MSFAFWNESLRSLAKLLKPVEKKLKQSSGFFYFQGAFLKKHYWNCLKIK